MLLKERIACVGVGQCGSNMVKELEKLDFNSFYVNTSLEDLDTIITDKKNKYHIKGTKGMAKDRHMAKECILSGNTAENVVFAINDQYSMVDIVVFYYSLSGGTGGTMGNFIAEEMSDTFRDKTIIVVAIKGKSTEDVGLQANAIESLTHLKTLLDDGIITQVHLLDNDNRDDIFSINKDFALSFDKFVSFDEITTEGNLDEEEKEKLLIEHGMAVMLEFEDEDFANGLSNSTVSTLYTNWIKNPTLHGLILNRKQNKEINKAIVQDVLGIPNYTHGSTWNEDSNVLFASGMSFNETILTILNKNASELAERKKKMENDSMKEIENGDEVKFDTSSVLGNKIRRKPSSQLQSPSAPSRRRGERNGSDAMDKYRSMGNK